MSLIVDICQMVAVISSPLISIYVTERVRKNNQKRNDKMLCFLDLLGTRHLSVDERKTRAYNSIDILFSEDKNVINAWKELYEILHQADRVSQWESVLPISDFYKA